MADQTPVEMREQAKRLRELAERERDASRLGLGSTIQFAIDMEAGADALDELADRRESPVAVRVDTRRCMACGLPDHRCPTGGRLLR